MIMLRNPYEGIWEKHRSIDDMDMILESRTGGTDYGRLSVLSATANDKQSIRTNTAVSGQAGTIAEQLSADNAIWTNADATTRTANTTSPNDTRTNG